MPDIHSQLLVQSFPERLVDLSMEPTRTQPPAAPRMSGEFLVHSGEGQSYSKIEADERLAQTVWGKLERRPLAGASSFVKNRMNWEKRPAATSRFYGVQLGMAF